MDLEMNKIKTIMTSISNELITQEEYSQLFDTVKELLDDYIKENILDFSKPNFHEELFSSIYELLEVQFEYLNMSDSHYIFYIIYEKVSKIYFKFVNLVMVKLIISFIISNIILIFFDLREIILSGFGTEPLLESPFLIISTNSMPLTTLPKAEYCLSK